VEWSYIILYYIFLTRGFVISVMSIRKTTSMCSTFALLTTSLMCGSAVAATAPAPEWWQIEDLVGNTTNETCAELLNGQGGSYAPVTSMPGMDAAHAVAIAGTNMYLSDASLQTTEDQNIFSACQFNASDILNSVVVTGACEQAVGGTAYVVESSFTVPCSDQDLLSLGYEIDLNRTIVTSGYVPLPVGGVQQEAQVETVEGMSEDYEEEEEEDDDEEENDNAYDDETAEGPSMEMPESAEGPSMEMPESAEGPSTNMPLVARKLLSKKHHHHKRHAKGSPVAEQQESTDMPEGPNDVPDQESTDLPEGPNDVPDAA
jgi:hypothetical protein